MNCTNRPRAPLQRQIFFSSTSTILARFLPSNLLGNISINSDAPFCAATSFFLGFVAIRRTLHSNAFAACRVRRKPPKLRLFARTKDMHHLLHPFVLGLPAPDKNLLSSFAVSLRRMCNVIRKFYANFPGIAGGARRCLLHWRLFEGEHKGNPIYLKLFMECERFLVGIACQFGLFFLIYEYINFIICIINWF